MTTTGLTITDKNNRISVESLKLKQIKYGVFNRPIRDYAYEKYKQLFKNMNVWN